MRYSKIVLAGGSGYIGRVLTDHFRSRTEEIVILSRGPSNRDENVRTINWNAKEAGTWVHEIGQADLLVNLCGKSMNCRYTPENKKELVDSRVGPTRLLGTVISRMTDPPEVWINLSAASIYQNAERQPQDDVSGEIGYGFSTDVCRRWEESFEELNIPATRKVILRMGIVLGRFDGVFPRLLNLVRAGMGGAQGDGKQMVSWVHEQDVARIVEWLLSNDISGAINCTAPEAVTNEELMKLIRKTYGIPIGIPSPQWLLEIGAMIIGTEPELILKSRWVRPRRLEESGYSFLFPTAAPAVRDILSTSA